MLAESTGDIPTTRMLPESCFCGFEVLVKFVISDEGLPGESKVGEFPSLRVPGVSPAGSFGILFSPGRQVL